MLQKIERELANHILAKLPTIQNKLLERAKGDFELLAAYATGAILNISRRGETLQRFMHEKELSLDDMDQIKHEMIDLGWEEDWQELTWLTINRKRWSTMRSVFGDKFVVLVAEENGDYVTFDEDADIVIRLNLTMQLGRGNVHDDYSHFHFHRQSFEAVRYHLKAKGKGVIVV